MSFIEINPDLRGIVRVLTRIADALDRAYPPRNKRYDGKPESVLLSVTDEELSEWENDETRLQDSGLLAEQQQRPDA